MHASARPPDISPPRPRRLPAHPALSLADIARRAGLAGPGDAELAVLRMVEAGEVAAHISQRDGMVHFTEEGDAYHTGGCGWGCWLVGGWHCGHVLWCGSSPPPDALLWPPAAAMTAQLDGLIGRAIQLAQKLAAFDTAVSSDRRACRRPGITSFCSAHHLSMSTPLLTICPPPNTPSCQGLPD